MAWQKTMLSNQKDLPLLRYLWRWKLLTTAALSKKFYSGINPATAYNHLMNLKRAGFLQTVPIYLGQGYVWTLTPKGFKAINNSIPELQETGFKSENMEHDLIVTAAHLGDWLVATPKDVDLFSEQQLRRYYQDDYPEWVPTNIMKEMEIHRADGYWHIPRTNGPMTVALEVELNRKCTASYIEIGQFYASEKKVDRVLWIVPTIQNATNIQKRLAQASQVRPNIHNFVTLKHFQEKGWSASICQGPENGKSIREFLNQDICQSFVKRLSDLTTNHLLDTRKSPSSSKLAKSSAQTSPQLT